MVAVALAASAALWAPAPAPVLAAARVGDPAAAHVEVAEEHYHYPVAVDLVHEGCRLLLHRVEHPAQIDYPDAAQTLVCLQTDNIVATMDSLRRHGAELLHDAPQPFPAGVFAAFRDPFGNVHELVEFRSQAA